MTEWPEGWRAIDNPALGERFEAELARELSPRHPLFGSVARLLGRRDKRDDFLFAVAGDRVADVHLTWRPETDPR